MRVLIAEDSPGMRKIVAHMMEKLGWDQVVTVEDGEKAWEQIENSNVDLLLTDCNMPRMSGLELTRRVRQRYSPKVLPILMFTGLNSRDDILAAVRAGVNGYLVKPFTLGQLQQRLSKLRTRPRSRTLGQMAQSVVERSRRPSVHEEGPLILIGEPISSTTELSDPRHRDITVTLTTLAEAVEALNREFGDLSMYYYLESDAARIARLMRYRRKGLKMLVVSAQMAGGTTLARLARINQVSSVDVVLVVDGDSQPGNKERQGLEKIGVLLVERSRMDRDFLSRLLREHVVAQVRGAIDTVPTPQEILERIETDVSLLTTLPVLPWVFHRIMKLSRDRYSDMEAWIEAVRTDPLSSAMVIRRANSPLYGFRGQVTELAKAVTLLGKNTVKQLITTHALQRSLQQIRESRFSLEEYWTHSLGVGLVARMLTVPMQRADQTGEQRQEFARWQLGDSTVQLLAELKLDQRVQLDVDEDAFVSGMMHDIGTTALAHCYPALFPMLLDALEEAEWEQPMWAIETELAGITHMQVGQILAASWGLEPSVCGVIATHHEPTSDNGLAQVCHVANALASTVYPYPRSPSHPMVRALREGESPRVEEGDPDGDILERFLSSRVLAGLGLDRAQILQLALPMSEDLHRHVDAIRGSMRE